MTLQSSSVVEKSETEQGFNVERVVTLSGAHLVHDIYTAFVAPLLPLIMEKLSLSLTMVGSLTALMQLPSLLNPFIGYLADKVSLRYFVIFAPAITATLICTLGYAPTYLSLAVILFLTGISVAAFHAPAPAMVGRISGKRVGKGMSFFMAGGELGRTLGPLLSLWAVSIWTLDGLMRVAVLGWASTIILYWRLKDVSGKPEKAAPIIHLLPKFKSLYLPLAVLLFLRLFLQVSFDTYLPTFLNNTEGLSIYIAGISLTVFEVAGVVGALLSGTLSDRIGRKPMLIYAILLSGILTSFFLLANGWIRFILLLLIGFSVLSTGPVLLALVQDNVPNNRAVGNGIYISIAFLMRSLVLFLVGLGGDIFGLRITYYISIGLSFIAIFTVRFLPESKEFSTK
jgi:FSR family fosmidomycin resistance protein-like MFS transporter